MRKKVLSMMLAGIMAISLGAIPAYADSRGSLTIMIGSGDGGGVAAKATFDKAAEIMGIDVEYSVFPDDQFLNILNTKGATGNLDDIIFTSYSLSDMPYNELAVLEGEWINKITDVSAQFTVHPETGETIFAPFGGETNMGFAYNKAVLENAGVTLPIADYASFVEACEKIKASGVTPVYVSAQENWTAQILLLSSFTTTLLKDDLVDKLAENQVKPQEVDSIVKIWDNVRALQDKGFLNEDYKSATHDMGKKAIANGEAAFYCVTDGTYGEILTEYPDLIDGVGMTCTPMWDDKEDAFVMANRTSRCIAVSKNSKNLELAKEFVNTCLTEEVMRTYYELSPGKVPFNDLGFELPMSDWNKEMSELSENLPSYGDWANALYDGQPKLNPFWGRFDLRVQSMFTGKSAEEALTDWYTEYAANANARRVEGF